MIQTLMALWNRGTSGRLLVMALTFFSLCISISLLFVTVGSIWGSLLVRGGRPGNYPQMPASNAVLVTATVPASVTATIAPAAVTSTLLPNPCLASPTEARGNTTRVDATHNNGRRSIPARTPTSQPLHSTPTPHPTIQPTPPAVTPTVSVTPAVTPTATTTPGSTATATQTPAGTSTAGATPTPTVTLTPTDTSTPGATPTATATGTSMNTPTATTTGTPVTTVTAPAGSPTVIVSATTGISGRQVHDGRPQIPGTSGDANNGQTSQGNCLGDALVTDDETGLLSRLGDFMWVILVSSLLGTVLFCRQMYRLSRKTRG